MEYQKPLMEIIAELEKLRCMMAHRAVLPLALCMMLMILLNQHI
jgi:hypothetical protein